MGLDTSDYTVSSLHKYWLYHISVAGRTSVGHGIYTTVTVMTDDNGRNFIKFSEIFFLHSSEDLPIRTAGTVLVKCQQ